MIIPGTLPGGRGKVEKMKMFKVSEGCYINKEAVVSVGTTDKGVWLGLVDSKMLQIVLPGKTKLANAAEWVAHRLDKYDTLLVDKGDFKSLEVKQQESHLWEHGILLDTEYISGNKKVYYNYEGTAYLMRYTYNNALGCDEPCELVALEEDV